MKLKVRKSKVTKQKKSPVKKQGSRRRRSLMRMYEVICKRGQSYALKFFIRTKITDKEALEQVANKYARKLYRQNKRELHALYGATDYPAFSVFSIELAKNIDTKLNKIYDVTD